MALEDFIPKQVDPAAPKTLDLAECRRLITAAPRHAFTPSGGMLVSFGEQLQFALNEISGAAGKVVAAQNDALRFQREAETANAELRAAHLALIAAREELAQLKTQQANLLNAQKPAEVPVAKKRGPKAKVVPMSPATEPNAAAQ